MKKIFFTVAIVAAITTVTFAQSTGTSKGKGTEEEKVEEEEEDDADALEFADKEGLFITKENANVDCKLNVAPLDKVVDLNGNVPEYFFKPVPQQGPADNRDDVSLILGGSNWIMNMKTGKLDSIPGPYDGVPTPDGEFIVSPAKGGHITFYDRNGLKRNSKETYDDAESGNDTLNGVYHSLGVLDKKVRPDGSKTVTYRAITDTITTAGESATVNSLQYKEYTFEISASGEKKLTGTNGAPQFLCSNYPKYMMKTPILSKNGKMLSAYNMETGTSVIFDIVKNAAGKTECKTKKDLGFAASKMEFSPDGERVVFAMNSLSTTPSKVDWYSSPDTRTHNMNVYTYDFKTDDMNKITSQPTGNAYYPSFSNDGQDVVFMSQELSDKGNERYAVKRIALADTPSMKYKDFSQMRSCNLTDNSTISMLAIGKLWESVCSELQGGMTASALATLPLSLSKASCEKLVNSYWDKFQKTNKSSGKDVSIPLDYGKQSDKSALSETDTKFYSDKILAIKPETLMATCSALKGVDSKAQPKVKKATMNDPVVKANPTQSCTQCHGSGERYIPFDKPDQLGPWKKKMLLHVMTGNMPKNMNLAVQERTDLIEYLEAIDDSGVKEQ